MPGKCDQERRAKVPRNDTARKAHVQELRATRDLAEEAANLAATTDAWPKTVDFLRRVLR